MSKVVRIVSAKPKLVPGSTEARTTASARLKSALCAAGLTQDEAGRLVGVDGRQVRRWLAKPPPVLQMLVELEAVVERKRAA